MNWQMIDIYKDLPSSDGEWVMVIVATAIQPRPFFMRWNRERILWENQVGTEVFGHSGARPTHWMPLPDPPSAV